MASCCNANIIKRTQPVTVLETKTSVRRKVRSLKSTTKIIKTNNSKFAFEGRKSYLCSQAGGLTSFEDGNICVDMGSMSEDGYPVTRCLPF